MLLSYRSMGSAPPRRANAVELGLDGAGLGPEPRTQCLSQPCSIPAPMVVPMEESPATRESRGQPIACRPEGGNRGTSEILDRAGCSPDPRSRRNRCCTRLSQHLSLELPLAAAAGKGTQQKPAAANAEAQGTSDRNKVHPVGRDPKRHVSGNVLAGPKGVRHGHQWRQRRRRRG